MATSIVKLGDYIRTHLTGMDTVTRLAAFNMFNIATDGTQEATSFISLDTNANQGVMKCTAWGLGTSGSEIDLACTGAEMNQAFDLSAKGEDVIATRVLTVADNGAVLFLAAAAGFTVTLPVLATLSAGWRCSIIIKTSNSSGNYVITETTASDTDKLVTNFISEGAVTTGNQGPYNADHATVTLSTSCVAGDWFEVETDGTVFYIHGHTNADAIVTLA